MNHQLQEWPVPSALSSVFHKKKCLIGNRSWLIVISLLIQGWTIVVLEGTCTVEFSCIYNQTHLKNKSSGLLETYRKVCLSRYGAKVWWTETSSPIVNLFSIADHWCHFRVLLTFTNECINFYMNRCFHIIPLWTFSMWCLSKDQPPKFEGLSSYPCNTAVLFSHRIWLGHVSYSYPTDTIEKDWQIERGIGKKSEEWRRKWQRGKSLRGRAKLCYLN